MEVVIFKLTSHARSQWKNMLGNRSRKCRVSVAERYGEVREWLEGRKQEGERHRVMSEIQMGAFFSGIEKADREYM